MDGPLEKIMLIRRKTISWTPSLFCVPAKVPIHPKVYMRGER